MSKTLMESIRAMPPPPAPVPKKNKTLRYVGVIVLIFIIIVVAVAIAYHVGSLSSSSSSQINQVQIKVQYSGAWSGAYGDINNIQHWSGTGTHTVTLDISSSLRIVAADAQKQDGSTDTLTISILKMDGAVLKTSITNTPYGMASVADNFGS